MTHTHDDRNVTMPAPDLGTDVFGYLMGEGFVMVSHEDSAIDNVLRRHCRISKVRFDDPMPSVADDVRALEGLLR